MSSSEIEPKFIFVCRTQVHIPVKRRGLGLPFRPVRVILYKLEYCDITAEGQAS